jgi:hypothetical protein
VRRLGREVEITTTTPAIVIDRLRADTPEMIATEALPLEEIFVATLQHPRASA